MKRQYEFFAIFTPNSSGGYGVHFPDLPGTLSRGDDDADALESARECLELHLKGLLTDGDPIPAPTPADMLEDELTPGARLEKIAVEIEVAEVEPPKKRGRGGVRPGAGRPSRAPQGNATQNLVIRVTPEENERLAELARRAGTTKSEYVRALVAAQK